MDKTGNDAIKNKGGAPLGNKNAYKQGFYAHVFNPAETQNLDSTDVGRLEDEIILMRVLILRTIEAINIDSQTQLADRLASLRTITLAIASLE